MLYLGFLGDPPGPGFDSTSLQSFKVLATNGFKKGFSMTIPVIAFTPLCPSGQKKSAQGKSATCQANISILPRASISVVPLASQHAASLAHSGLKLE